MCRDLTTLVIPTCSHPSGNMEDTGAEGDLNSGCLDQEISEQTNLSMLCGEHSCHVLVKNLAAFGLFMGSRPESKVKRFRLVALKEEVSKLPSMNCLLWFTLMKKLLIRHNKLRKEKYKMYGSSNKGAPGSRMEVNPVFQEIHRLREW